MGIRRHLARRLALVVAAVVLAVACGDDDASDRATIDSTGPTPTSADDVASPGTETPPPTDAVTEDLPPGDGSPAGDAVIATSDGTYVVEQTAACSVVPLVGSQVSSFLYRSEGGDGPFLVEVYVEEGAWIILTDLRGALEGWNGQDDEGTRWSAPTPDEWTPYEPVTDLVLQPDDADHDDAVVSFDHEPAEEDCALGFVGNTWPFADDEAPRVVDDTETEGSHGFAVLAACRDDVDTLLLSEGGILTSAFIGEQRSTRLTFPNPGGPPTYLEMTDPGTNDVFVPDHGGGGDVRYVTRVVDADTDESRYLTWVQPPHGATGGLPVVDCLP